MAKERYASAEVLRARCRDYYQRRKAGLVKPRVLMTEEERKEKARAYARKQYMRRMGYTSADQIRETATRDDMAERCKDLFAIVQESPPMTARQVFYQAEVRGLEGITKDDSGYQKVQRALARMRRGLYTPKLPWEWIVDNTRSVSKVKTYASLQAALKDCVSTYWMDLWTSAEERVQVWIEKDALAGLAAEVTNLYDVPLVCSRGVPSWGLLHEAATEIEKFDGPTFVYTFYDFDPKGEESWQLVQSGLKELAPHSDIRFKHVGVTRGQIERFNLPTRETKANGKTQKKRAEAFGPISCELDAFSAEQFRTLIRDEIERHLPADHLAVLQAEEEANRERLRELIDQIED
jgi:hypothetical protein